MKKIISLILVLSIVFCFVACKNETKEVNDSSYKIPEESDFTWEEVDGGVSVTSYTGNESSIKIPEQLGGKNVIGISDEAFSRNNSLENISMPDTITYIGKSAFDNCINLINIKFPKQLIAIDNFAFCYCLSLENLFLPENLKSIKVSAFAECDNIKEINIPSSVEEIEHNAFSGLSLSSINVDKDNENYCSDNGVLYNKDKTVLLKVPNATENFVIPKYVTTIGASAFAHSEIAKITIPDNISTIENGAFFQCHNLTSIKIPDSVTFIDDDVFWGCDALENIILPDKPIKLGLNIFSCSAYNINEDNWDNDVLYIGNHLVDITISDSDTLIIKNGTKSIAVGFSDRLKSVTIPDSVGYIPNDINYDILYKVKHKSYAENYMEEHGYNYMTY